MSDPLARGARDARSTSGDPRRVAVSGLKASRARASWLFLPLVLGIGVAGAAEEPALRNEDVVRMLVAGKAEPAVLASIRAGRTAFDLSEEMLEELRLAGVPPAVLIAMRERQAEIDRGAPHREESAAATPEAAAIVVSIRGHSGDAPARVAIPRSLDDDALARFEIDRTTPDRDVARAAVFLACRTPDHVPDQWRSKSPLGRDFVAVARHRMLDLRSVDLPRERTGSGKKPARIDLPSELSAAAEPGIVHDLVAGIAIEVGGRFLQVAEARLDGTPLPPGGLRLEIAIEAEAGSPWPSITLSVASAEPR